MTQNSKIKEGYEGYLNRLDGKLPGRKSRARKNFETFGELPPELDHLEGKLTVEDHRKIVEALAASDNELREADLKWYGEREAPTGEEIFDGPTLHSSATLGFSKDTPEKQPTRKGDETFMGEVQKLKEIQNLSTEEAMRAVVKLRPDLHDKSLKSQREPQGTTPTATAPTGGKPRTFTEAWQSIKAEGNCSTEYAMKQAVRKHPDLHKAMLAGKA